MGMYTVFHIDVRLRDDCPAFVTSILNYMLYNERPPTTYPEHPLFSTGRWQWMLHAENTYASSASQLTKDEHFGIRLHVTSSFKNYDGEVLKFLDWLAPYADPDVETDKFVGYTRYEENRYPDIIVYTQAPDGTPKFKLDTRLNEMDQA